MESADTTAIDVPSQKIVTSGSKAWGRKIRKEIQDLARRVDRGYMELAKLLYTVWDTPIDGDPDKGPIYQSWGYTTFDEYVEGDLGIDPKRAQRLRRIWYKIEIQLGDTLLSETKSRLIELGFAKVRELIRVINAVNTDEWIERAESMSHARLVELIDKYFDQLESTEDDMVAIGGDPDKATTLVPVPESDTLAKQVFHLYPAQSQNIDTAIGVAKKLSKSEKKGHNLDLIATHFMATSDFTKDEKDVEKYLTAIEIGLGLKLVAYDPRTGEIVHGFDTLEKMAGRSNED